MIQSHWHILGAGSIGLLFGAYLRKAGHRVTFISQHPCPEHSQVQLNGTEEESLTVECNPANNVLSIDFLLICTKSFQTRHALKTIEHALSDKTCIVLLQNGMANQQWLLESYPQQALFAAITTHGALRTAPWCVNHTGIGQTSIGPLNPSTIDIQAHLASNLVLQLEADIYPALWQKLVMNCCINPLTALHDCLNGELETIPSAMQMLPLIIHECRQIAKAQGYEQALVDSEQQLLQVMRQTAKNSSSMREDIRHGRLSEIDAINGYIVQQGQALGIDTPVNQQLLLSIRGLHHEQP